MDTNAPDLVRHQATMPDVTGPDDSYPLDMPVSGRDLRIVEKVDLMDPDDVGPAELNVWVKYAFAPPDQRVNAALIAHPSNHFSIATAMRPHKGVSQAMAHRTLSCGVLSLTVHFLEPDVKADQWLLYSHKSLCASHGLALSQANVFTRERVLVASFSQESMIRAMPEAPASSHGDRVL